MGPMILMLVHGAGKLVLSLKHAGFIDFVTTATIFAKAESKTHSAILGSHLYFGSTGHVFV
jgi:hypothetical protein